jgi:hypothetical protein
MQFHSIVQLGGGDTATGIRVPAEVVTGLGPNKQPNVLVTINGYTYHSSIASKDGVFMLPLTVEQRLGAHVAAYDEVVVDVELDSETEELTMPADFAEALEGNAEANRFFADLTPGHKRWYVTWIEETTTAESRQRRIDKAINLLQAGQV